MRSIRLVVLLVGLASAIVPLAATGTTPDDISATRPPRSMVQLGFPDAVDVVVLGEAEIAALPRAVAGLRLDRLSFPAESSAATRTASGPTLLYLETGAVEMPDELGIDASISAGESRQLDEGARFRIENSGAELATMLRLTLTSGGSEEAGETSGTTTLLDAEVASWPAAPMRVFLARVTWPVGAELPAGQVNGPLAMIGEGGTLTIGAAGRVMAVNPTRPLLVNAGATIWQRNGSDVAATLLVAGVVPVGMPAVSPLAPATPDQTPTGTSLATIAPVTPTPALPTPVSPPPTIAPIPTPIPVPPTLAPAPTTPPEPEPPSLGGILAYAARVGDQWDLFSYDVARGETTQLIDWPGSDEVAPAFSHTGRRLAFVSEVTGTSQVWVMDWGGSPRQVTSHQGPEEIFYVAWTPDDSRLIVTLRAPDTQGRLMIVPAEGGALSEYWPAWSSYPTMAPDGRWAHVTWAGSETDIYGVSPAGEVYPLAISAEDEDVPSMDPSGTRVAYNAGPVGNRRVETMPATGGEPTVLPRIGDENTNPVWSPDGTALAVVATTAEYDDIWIVPLTGGAPYQLDLPDRERLWYLTWAA